MTQKNNGFSYKITDFHEQAFTAEPGLLAGYAALIMAYDLKCPVPDHLSAIATKHKKFSVGMWNFFTPRHAPENSLYGHMTFALKNEGVDLSVFKALFDIVTEQEIMEILAMEPTGVYSRRIWFLYEWLNGKQIALPDISKGNFVDLVDPEIQYPGPSRPSRRHRVNNNLPGVRYFCPLIRRTAKLDEFISLQLPEIVRKNIGKIRADILMRAASFLLLKDSKASYIIEGENPPHSRIERWGNIIGQAGINKLSHDELLRLQKIVISDARFVKLGYRKTGGFIGEHDRKTGMPIPDHISARHDNVALLMDSLLEVYELLEQSDFPAVFMAASIAFGFVFIHPFEDGNGRIHRYLLHHVLAAKSFAPKGIIFPVSAVILDKIHQYRQILEAYSKPRLQFIKWRSTESGNVEVLNDTLHLYCYFDATKQAEFLWECVKETALNTLPEEIDYLQKYDIMVEFIKNYLDMPDRVMDLLIRFLKQNNGTLSTRARKKEFNALTDEEIAVIEEKYQQVYLS